MPRFRIRPADQLLPATEFTAPDAAIVLLIVQRLPCKEADVIRDGNYDFSIKLSDNGLWCLFHRDPPMAEVVPLAGWRRLSPARVVAMPADG